MHDAVPPPSCTAIATIIQAKDPAYFNDMTSLILSGFLFWLKSIFTCPLDELYEIGIDINGKAKGIVFIMSPCG